ncbi:MAG: enamine deaminase RidA [Ignavibacteria bacterium RBG_16_34_14]|nr:MAG: enamine deaminase RidA [Ignavibacteria bacterium RBG_16_34_14]
MKYKTLYFLITAAFLFTSCASKDNQVEERNTRHTENETHEYFLLRPEAEKNYGYSHAVRIGDELIISGAVSMDDSGSPTAIGNLEQQMKNCYEDLNKVLTHYGYSFDDVVVENIFTTNMAEFLKQSGYRNTIYKKNFPTGTWLEVKGLALPEFMIEIELEAHKSK